MSNIKSVDKLEAMIGTFSDSIHDLTFEVQDSANQEDYHEFLKMLKLLKGSPLFNVLVRSCSKEYVRRFGGDSDE